MSSISVILPTFNRVNRLKKTLPELLKTSAINIEIIIIDNNSSDGTVNYVTEMVQSDSRIRLIKNPQNIGVNRSVFRGLCDVRSPYVIFIADDDLMSGDYINQCLTIFNENPKVGLIHHDFNNWKNYKKNEPGYTTFQQGVNAVKNSYLSLGVWPGIAWRMSCIDLKSFPLDIEVLYGQVKVSLEIALEHEYAKINNCGLVSMDWGDTIQDIQLNRPVDYGLNERLSYLFKIKDKKLIQGQLFAISDWILYIYNQKKIESKKTANKFMVSLAGSYHFMSPVLIFKLLKSGNILISLTISIYLLRYPSFIVNYFIFLGLFFKKYDINKNTKKLFGI